MLTYEEEQGAFLVVAVAVTTPSLLSSDKVSFAPLLLVVHERSALPHLLLQKGAAPRSALLRSSLRNSANLLSTQLYKASTNGLQ